jgi:gliding motility-associated-like protein
VSATGGTAPYTYAWSTAPVQTSATAVNLTNGTYTVTVRDARLCETTTTVTIGGPSAPLSATITGITPVLCFGGDTGGAVGAASGGTPPYQYLWSTVPNATTASINGQIAGTYVFNVTDANGCTTATTATIPQPSSGIAGFVESIGMVSCHGGQDGNAVIGITGGSGSYNVVWNTNPVQTGTSISGLGAGTYLAQVLDQNGCTEPKFLPVTITQPAAPLAATLAPIVYNGGFNTSCSNATDGGINATITGGTQPYTITWSTPGGQSLTTEDIFNLAPGSYTLQVLDANGCTTSASVALVAPTAILAVGQITPAACQGAANGAIDLTAQGGVGPYTYSWSGPAGFSSNAADINTLASGVYTVIVTDANGCTNTFLFDVAQPGMFTASATVSAFPGGAGVSCANATNGSIAVDLSGGTPGYTYAWSGPNGFTASTEDIASLAAGTYQLIYTDANGCSGSLSAIVTPPAPLGLAITPSVFGTFNLACNGGSNGSATLTITGGVTPQTIVWTGPNGSTFNTASITNLPAGTYTVLVTDVNGCQATTSITLTEPPALTASASIVPQSNGGAISCTGTSDGAIDLSVNGGTTPYTVNWSGPNGYSSNAFDPTGLAPGIYTALITDARGCTASASITLTEPDPLVVQATVSSYLGGQAISCFDANDGTIDLNVSGGAGGYLYAWTGSPAYASTNEDISGLGAGTYTVNVSDINGCQTQATFTLSDPDPINAGAAVINALCQGTANGSIDLTITGGTAPYTQTWSSGFGTFSSTAEDLNNLFAGVYTVSILDANGCTFQRSFNVDEPEQFLIDGRVEQFPGGSNVSCAGASDGSIEVLITGGTMPYSLTWLTPNGPIGNTTLLADLPVGTYELIIVDANNCSGLAAFELVGPTPIAIGLLPSQYPGGANTTCDQATSGSIDALVDGGISPYSFAWTGPNGTTYSTEDITGLGAGTYDLLVTDLTGCQGTAAITLTQPAPLTTTIDVGAASGGGSIACSGTNDGFIDLTTGGGTAPYQYLWTGTNGFGSASEDISGLAAGTYTVDITDLNGCTTTATAVIQEPSPISVTLAVGEFGNGLQLPCFGSAEGSVTATATGGTPTYTYAWTGPNGFTASTATISNVPAGNYTLVVTDLNGCSTTVQTTLQQPQPLAIDALISDAGSGYQVSCLGNDGVIDLTISGGTAPYITAWSSDNGSAFNTSDITGIGAGTYTLQLADANGCTTTLERTLTAPAPIATSTTTSAVICNGASDGTIDLAVSGGVGNYTYAWSGPDGFTASTQDLSGLTGGTYTVVIGDDANCTASTNASIVISGAMDAAIYRSTYGAVNIPCVGDSTGVLEVNVTGGTAPVTIAWTGPDGFNSSAFDLSGLVAGSYAFTLTDANGCTMDSTITLVEPTDVLDALVSAQLQASGTNISCFEGSDGTIDATASGGTGPYTYAWRGPNDELFNSATISGLPAGVYELVVTDANACQDTASITLTEPDTALAITASLSDFGGPNVSCAGSADGAIGITLTGGSPSYSIAWTGPNGFTSTLDTLTDLSAGDYTVVITDINGCSLTLTSTIAAPEPISTSAVLSSFTGGAAISCADATDGSIALSTAGGTGTTTIAWTGPNGFTATGANISGLGAGTYCATLTDSNGCSADTCLVISAPAPLDLQATSVSASCGAANASATATITGGAAPYAYAWSNGSTSATIADLAPGTYDVQVTDANACVASLSITITGTPALEASLSPTAPLCHGSDNGSIAIAIANGQAPYAYAWSTGDAGAQLTGLGAGTYAVTVTDANGCQWNSSTTLTEPTAVEVEGSTSSYAGGFQVSGFGASDGSIALTTTGGVVPYTYAWNTGANTADISGLTAGTYSVTVTDANGCPLFLEFVLEGPDDLRQPTGFTPNNDGSNDVYIVRGLEAYPENLITIFNRWGNVVYERINYRNDWAGENMSGEPLPNGTYFVIVSIPALDLTLQNYVDLRR